MTEYHKIHAPFKRHKEGPKKGRLIVGDWSLPEFEYLKDNEWEWTEKVDGTNIRIIWDTNGLGDPVLRFGGRTERAVIPKPLQAHLYETFTYDKMWKSALSCPTVLYGEGYGPGIQHGGLYRKDQSFVLFDVRVGRWWLKREDVQAIADCLGIDTVPVLGYGTLAEAISVVRPRAGGLQSRWGEFEAEGIVARPRVPLFARDGSRIITKIKGVDFKQ